MRVVITNDDGIDAPGLRRLAAMAAAAGHDVVVAAPHREASGSSAGLSAVARNGRLVVRRTRLAGVPDVAAYAVEASPAYIALLANLGAFGPPPRVLLSGINRGANAGQAVLHSGTVGAALTAADRGGRAMAVSLDVLSPATAATASGGAAVSRLDRVDDESRHWDTAAWLATRLLPVLLAAPAGTVLNLNVPDVPRERLRGLRRAELARFGQVEITIVEAGEGFIRTAVKENGARQQAGTDLSWLADGYASITPLHPVGEDRTVDLELELGLPLAGS